ncbi:MAG: preprotein translocase subunit SecE [Bilifractor sp.]
MADDAMEVKKDKAKKPAKDKKKKESWFKGLKTEWDKIVWTEPKTLGRQTAAVVVISAVVCVLITLIDNLGLQLVQLIIK